MDVFVGYKFNYFADLYYLGETKMKHPTTQNCACYYLINLICDTYILCFTNKYLSDSSDWC